MRWTSLVFALSCTTACVVEGPDDDACLPGGNATLAIGAGEDAYVRVAPGGDLPLREGAGGAQVPIGLLATHLDASDLMEAHLEAEILDAAALETSVDASLDFRCDLDAGGLVTWGTLLTFDATLDQLAGATARVTATATDVAGTEVTVTTDFVLRP